MQVVKSKLLATFVIRGVHSPARHLAQRNAQMTLVPQCTDPLYGRVRYKQLEIRELIYYGMFSPSIHYTSIVIGLDTESRKKCERDTTYCYHE